MFRALFEEGVPITITIPHGKKYVDVFDDIEVVVDPFTFEGAEIQHFRVSLFCLRTERSITERVNVRYRMTECVYQIGVHKFGAILLPFVPRAEEYPLQFSLVA